MRDSASDFVLNFPMSLKGGSFCARDASSFENMLQLSPKGEMTCLVTGVHIQSIADIVMCKDFLLLPVSW